LSEATTDEQKQVKEWLDADEANLDYYTQLKRVWDDSRQLAQTITVDENKAWKKLQGRIHPAPIRLSNFGWLKIAASIIIVAGIGLTAYFLTDKSKEVTVLAKQTVLNDTLSDGSVVTINKGSSISYNSRLRGDTRKVELKGEAFFNVTPNKKKPFVISINDVQITVVGTSFNVKNNNGNTEVVVETGIVKVTKAGQTVELKANEKIEVHARDSVLNKEQVSDKLYNYYRTKQFVCDETPLWKLVEVISQAYDSHIVIGNPAIRNLTITTTFDNESLDQVLNVIIETFNITIIKEGDTITLK